jgi:putative ABC transport system permease protein
MNPNWNHIVREHLAALRLPPERESEIVEELALHLEAAYEDALAAGLSEAEAEARAVQGYDWRLLECEVRRAEQPLAVRAWQPPLELIECKGGMRMESLLQDLRFGARMLMKQPGVTLIAALTLALGIGANTALFSVINAILLRPLPYAKSEELVQVFEANAQQNHTRFSFSMANFVDHRDQQTSFEQMAAYARMDGALTGVGEPERIQAAFVSPALLPLLRVQPSLGRGFLAEEETRGKNAVTILSHSLWSRRFGADPRIINQPITLSGETFTVVGVLPPHFQFPDPFGANPLSDSAPKVDLLIALAYDRMNLGDRGSHYFQVIGRLKPGVTPAQAQSELRAIAGRLEQQYPDRNKGWTINVFGLQDEVVRAIRPALQLLLAAVGFVLLIACANVSNLLLARAGDRQKEMAVRLALGAPRTRLLRQLLTEGLLLSLLGGTAGLALAYLAIRAFAGFSPADVPRVDEIRLDGAALLFTFGTTTLASVLFGLIPALQASKPDVQEALKEGGRSAGSGRRRARGLLVVTEVALSLLLLIGAGLMIRSFIGLQRVHLGFRTDNLLTMKLALPIAKYNEPQKRATFYQQAIERIKALPGVQSVGAVTDLPLTGESDVYGINIEGRPREKAWDDAEWRAINTDYFRTMGISMVGGREFTERDNQGAPEVVIINETAARRWWPGEEPIGKRVRLYDDEQLTWREIIGVVRDIKHFGPQARITAEIYVPFLQRPREAMTLVAHTSGQPELLATAMRAAVQSVDKEQPVYRVRTMERFLSDAVASPRATAFLLVVLAFAALALAAVGIYGVMVYAVTQRTHEIGIRMALGARGGDVLAMVIKQGMRLAGIGVTIGLVAAFVLTRLMKDLLFGVRPTDPATFVALALLLIGVAMLACYLPARRATKVDPLTALRHE